MATVRMPGACQMAVTAATTGRSRWRAIPACRCPVADADLLRRVPAEAPVVINERFLGDTQRTGICAAASDGADQERNNCTAHGCALNRSLDIFRAGHPSPHTTQIARWGGPPGCVTPCSHFDILSGRTIRAPRSGDYCQRSAGIGPNGGKVPTTRPNSAGALNGPAKMTRHRPARLLCLIWADSPGGGLLIS